MRIKILVGTLLAGLFASQAALAVTVTNGSLTGPIVNGGVPAGWSVIAYSPDTNDVANNVGGGTPFAAAPVASPDGGTWVGIADDGGAFVEVFGQSVSGFSVGQSYAVSWYQANFGAITGPGYSADDNIRLLVDGAIAGASAVSILGGGWTHETVSFVASATTHLLSFGTGVMAGNSYISIDGISVANGVPAPAGLGLLVLGMLVFGRRRAQN